VVLLSLAEPSILAGGLGDLIIRVSSRASCSSSDNCGGRELLRGGLAGGEDIVRIESQIKTTRQGKRKIGDAGNMGKERKNRTKRVEKAVRKRETKREVK